MSYYTTNKQNLYTLSSSTPLRIRTPLGYYRLVEGKLTYMYVRSHGKVENHRDICYGSRFSYTVLFAITPTELKNYPKLL